MGASPSTTENAALIDAMTADGWDREYVVDRLDTDPSFAVRWLRHYGIAPAVRRYHSDRLGSVTIPEN